MLLDECKLPSILLTPPVCECRREAPTCHSCTLCETPPALQVDLRIAKPAASAFSETVASPALKRSFTVREFGEESPATWRAGVAPGLSDRIFEGRWDSPSLH